MRDWKNTPSSWERNAILGKLYNAKTGKYRLLKLLERADDRKLPVIRIIDMRVQRKKNSADAILGGPIDLVGVEVPQSALSYQPVTEEVARDFECYSPRMHYLSK